MILDKIANRERMEERAIEILKKLEEKGLDKEVREYFEQGKLSISHCEVGLKEMSPAEVQAVKEHEEEFNDLIFHAVYTNTNIGPMISYLFISKYEEDWHMDIPLIEENKIYSYVENMNDKICSEYGIIVFDIDKGCMRRVF